MKISKINRDRIFLYGGLFLVFLAASVFSNVRAAQLIEENGRTLLYTDMPFGIVTEYTGTPSLEEMAQQGRRQKVFTEDNLDDVLENGSLVVLDTSPDAAAPHYVLLTGTDEQGFIVLDGDTRLPDTTLFYRCYIYRP